MSEQRYAPSPYRRSRSGSGSAGSSPRSGSARSSSSRSAILVGPGFSEALLPPSQDVVLPRQKVESTRFSPALPFWSFELLRALNRPLDPAQLLGVDVLKEHPGSSHVPKVVRFRLASNTGSVYIYVRCSYGMIKIRRSQHEFLIGEKLKQHRVPGFAVPATQFFAIIDKPSRSDDFDAIMGHFIVYPDYGSRSVPPTVPSVADLVLGAQFVVSGLTRTSKEAFDSTDDKNTALHFLWGDSNVKNLVWHQSRRKFYIIDYDNSTLYFYGPDEQLCKHSPKDSSVDGPRDITTVKQAIFDFIQLFKSNNPLVGSSEHLDSFKSILTSTDLQSATMVLERLNSLLNAMNLTPAAFEDADHNVL